MVFDKHPHVNKNVTNSPEKHGRNYRQAQATGYCQRMSIRRQRKIIPDVLRFETISDVATLR